MLHQCFPDLAVASIEFLGGGTFRVFEVNTGAAAERNLVFRFPHGGAGGELLRRERRACDVLRALLPLPVPRYDFFSDDCGAFGQPVGGYRKLAGVALQDCALTRASLRCVAADLGRFLTALHAVPKGVLHGAGLPCFTPAQMRAAQSTFYAEVQQHAFPILSARERAWTRALFEPFLADAALWCFEPALVHGDFDASNILCDPVQGQVMGVIDFEEGCWGDPAWDFCVLVAEFGPSFLWELLAAYGLPLGARAMERITFHSQGILFHELLYGIEANAQPFLDHGLVRLRRAMMGLEPIGGWLAASTSETRSFDGLPD
jgi:aminoglycoside 2''-phosphotransferase